MYMYNGFLFSYATIKQFFKHNPDNEFLCILNPDLNLPTDNYY